MSVHELIEPGLLAGGAERAVAVQPIPDSRPRHLRVVERPEFGDVRRRRLVRLGAAVAVGLVVAVLFVSVGMHVSLAQNQFRLDRLNAQAAAEQAKYQQLRLQVDRLAAPQRIIATAQQKLGMVQPGSITYLAPSSSTPASGPVAGGSTIPPAAVAPSWSALKPQLAANP